MHELAGFASCRLVYIHKSSCDESRLPQDRLVTIWNQPSTEGKVPADQTYHVLPAYTQDIILIAHVHQDLASSEAVRDLLENSYNSTVSRRSRNLFSCWDNAFLHEFDSMKELYVAAGTILARLIPGPFSLHPMEEPFAEPEVSIRRDWKVHRSDPQELENFLKWCLEVAGARTSSAKGPF